MGTLTLRLPDSIHRHIKGITRRKGVSINQFISSAVAEKVPAIMTEKAFEARVRQAKKGTLERILDEVPDRPLLPGDERK